MELSSRFCLSPLCGLRAPRVHPSHQPQLCPWYLLPPRAPSLCPKRMLQNRIFIDDTKFASHSNGPSPIRLESWYRFGVQSLPVLHPPPICLPKPNSFNRAVSDRQDEEQCPTASDDETSRKDA